VGPFTGLGLKNLNWWWL